MPKSSMSVTGVVANDTYAPITPPLSNRSSSSIMNPL